MTSRFATVGMTACGVILAAVPLALWVAWTPTVFFAVLATGAASMVLLGVFLSRSPSGNSESSTGDRNEVRTVLPDEFVEEIHEIFPLTYHHARIGKARYRRTMDRLKRMIR